jgi:phosphoesterase RecJ-like protein
MPIGSMNCSNKLKMTWPELAAAIADNRSFLISSHVNPDGDCIGSQLAMAWYCRSLGKEVAIYNRDPIPSKLAFLDGTAAITTLRPDRGFDALIVLDASNLSRLGWEGAASIAPRIINIDHHTDNTRFGAANIVDTAMAATGEILYNFFTACDIAYPPAVAEALYAAIMTDTGGFRFDNTCGRVLRSCAAIAERGVDCSKVFRNIYASRSAAAMLLLSRIWSTLSFHHGNRICCLELPLAVIDEVGATYGDSEGIADITVMAEGVQVGIMIKHFSLRSNSTLDVGRIARSIPGGGGHTNAAGCTLPLPVEAAKLQMLAIIAKELG